MIIKAVSAIPPATHFPGREGGDDLRLAPDGLVDAIERSSFHGEAGESKVPFVSASVMGQDIREREQVVRERIRLARGERLGLYRSMHRSSVAVAWIVIGLGIAQLSQAEPNELTPEEKKAGWNLLFDGKTTEGWRSYGRDSFPTEGWRAQDGWLEKIDRAGGGDIMTKDTFADFELQWEWKIVPKGNNGVKYFILQERKATIGHEYQMMDDMGKTDKFSTASFYEVLAAAPDKPMKPAGEINHSRIVVQGQHVEHWLNGAKVLSYTLGSPEVMEAVRHSKFKNVAGFGTKVRGHILLTDHRDGCWFRNLKIRELPAE